MDRPRIEITRFLRHLRLGVTISTLRVQKANASDKMETEHKLVDYLMVVLLWSREVIIGKETKNRLEKELERRLTYKVDRKSVM